MLDSEITLGLAVPSVEVGLDEEQKEVVVVLDLSKSLTPEMVDYVKHMGSGSRQKERMDSLSKEEKEEYLVKSFNSKESKRKSALGNRSGDPSVKKKVSLGLKEYWSSLSEEDRQKLNLKNSLGVREFWGSVDPLWKESFLARTIKNPENQIKAYKAGLLKFMSGMTEEERYKWHSLQSKLSWSSMSEEAKLTRHRSRHKGLVTRPTWPELVVKNILDIEYPNRWLYNGGYPKGKVIGKKIPDFIHSSSNKVIEVLGTFWHLEEEEDSIVRHYSYYGYECICIWEYMCGYPKDILERLDGFGY